ncbi:secreted protein [Colletotrichum plurivorum]|uniref:Secreted protein n=1 Tax=Colletotrichum plurivorum TaxID=2175906 RepID=A0A8H6N8M0_9PEZI|nr:secreted protein [Colletotrichum plurivorum]
MQLTSLLSAVLWATAVLAALNEPCYGSGGRAGVCVTTSACSSAGGTTIDNACPADPANVKCCTKASCGSGGNCRYTSDCAGTTAANQCPGPSSFKCCSSSAQGFGGYSAPAIPGVGACKKVAVDGAKKIVAAFPGHVRQVFCIRDCQCNVDPSDHCCGKATDMMCSDAGGAPTASGREIAEWVMKNRNALNLKYVIWGQRIWTVGKDAEKSWNSWRTQGDLDSITKNHWDHVHVSYN